MGFVESLIGKAPIVKIGEVSVAASINEDHNIEASVTEHPVEAGSDITDHYRTNPRTLQIEALVTNTPIATGYPGQTAINSLTSLITGDDPVLNSWAEIESYFDTEKIITIETSLKLYTSMVLTRFAVNRNAGNGQNLRFSCSARQIKIVTTEETEAIEEPQTTTTEKDTPPKPKGAKPPKPASPEQTKSALAKLLDAGTGFFS